MLFYLHMVSFVLLKLFWTEHNTTVLPIGETKGHGEMPGLNPGIRIKVERTDLWECPLTSIGAHVHINTDGHTHTLINKNKQRYIEKYSRHTFQAYFFIVMISVAIVKPWNFLIFPKSLYSEVDIPIYLGLKPLSNALQSDRVCCCLCGLQLWNIYYFRNQNRKYFKMQENCIICLILL